MSPRGIRCPGSVLAGAEVDVPDNDNKYARMGTQCHAVMELSLMLGELTYTDDDFDEPDTQIELCESAWKMIWGLLEEHDMEHNFSTEKKVTLQKGIFGTVDVAAHNPVTGVTLIADFKFGYNPVDPNEQLFMYYVGYAQEIVGPVQNVILAVIQPKVSSVPSILQTTHDSIMAWYSDTLVPAIEEAQSDNPRFIPGEVQCRFCPVAKVGCKYQTDTYLKAMEDFSPDEKMAHDLDDDELTRLLVMVPAMKDAIKAVELAGLERLKAGSDIVAERFKLVEGRTLRRWADIEQAEEWLKSKRFKQADIYSKKLVSPAAAEKLVKTKRLSAEALREFRDMIEKPTGELKLAPRSDRRKEVIHNTKQLLSDDGLENLT